MGVSRFYDGHAALLMRSRACSHTAWVPSITTLIAADNAPFRAGLPRRILG